MQALSEAVTAQSALVNGGKSNPGKVLSILSHSALATRAMMGSRMTSCKSAKDRTSMFQTYEVAKVMQNEAGLNVDDVLPMANTLRENGCRLDNCKLNTGKRKFAFNAVQRPHLPVELCPPASTCGEVES